MLASTMHTVRPTNVLLVEDDEVDAKWAVRALSNPSFPVSVEHVDRLDLALARLETNDIQAVLLDLGLPDAADGISSIERIHSLDPDLPIIVYSGSAYEPTGLLAIEKGALYYFPKTSGDGEKLAHTLQRALERFQMQTNLRRIIESSGDGMAILSPNHKLLFANPAAEALLNINPLRDFEYVFPYALDTGTTTELQLSERTTVELRVTHIEWNGRPALLASLRDISERQRLEMRLRQAHKMEAIGLLASGLAHDFNNVLTVITGFAELALDNAAQSSPMERDLLEIKNASDRAIALIRRLLTFSRQDSNTPRVIDVDAVVTRVHALLHRLIGADINMFLVTGAGDHRILADPDQLEHVIINFAVNARDAMPNGGTLTIETDVAFLRRDDLPGEQSPGEYLRLTVSDNGTGMNRETIDHIFEPFFTTKAASQGTGLGLATTYGIVQQNNGFITVESEPGVGTTFDVYFPLVNTDALADVAAPLKVSHPPQGNETILLVEDEDSVRRYASKVLVDRGYTVLEAEDPERALKIAAQRIRDIDAVVTDIVMPRMNGRELFERLRKLAPGLPVLFVSGYTADTVMQRGILDVGMKFLQKPFSPAELTNHVRMVLDEARPASRPASPT